VTLRIGVTGGIGCGKTSVANAFIRLGVPVVDTDAIAHELSIPGAAGQKAVAAEFGADAVAADGSLNRPWLRRQAFADPTFRARLESLLHPLIGAEALRRMASWTAAYGLCVVPLLFESARMLRNVDRVLVVDCPEDVQVARVMARSGLPAAEVRAIMAAQVPRAERLARADDVIDNGGPPEALAPQVTALDRRYRSLSSTGAKS
jgi:dephospho-CoA kinase